MSEFINLQKKHWRRIKILIAMAVITVFISMSINDAIHLLTIEEKANSNYYIVTPFILFILILPYIYIGYVIWTNYVFEQKYRNENE